MRPQFNLAHMDALLTTMEYTQLTQPQADAMNEALQAMRMERNHQPAGLTPEEVDAVWAMGKRFDSAQTEATAVLARAAFGKFARCWCDGLKGHDQPLKLGLTHASGGEDDVIVRLIHRSPDSPFRGKVGFDVEAG